MLKVYGVLPNYLPQKTTKDTKRFVPEGLDERSGSTELAERPSAPQVFAAM